jgi:hypothetical protein
LSLLATISHLSRTRTKPIAKATPTAFHWMMNNMVKRGDSIRIYTQNIDGLEVRCPWLSDEPLPGTKDPFSNAVALHGSINRMGCRKFRQVQQVWSKNPQISWDTPFFFPREDTEMCSTRAHCLPMIPSSRLSIGLKKQNAGFPWHKVSKWSTSLAEHFHSSEAQV